LPKSAFKAPLFPPNCSKLMDGLRCIDAFTVRCLDPEHRNYFNTLYQGTTQVIVDLCKEGAYQSGGLVERAQL
jgi:hypothetical protein